MPTVDKEIGKQLGRSRVSETEDCLRKGKELDCNILRVKSQKGDASVVVRFLQVLPSSLYRTIRYASKLPFWRWF